MIESVYYNGKNTKGTEDMSERQEHKKRYNMRLEYIARFNKWLDAEPPIVLFLRWKKWKKNRPVWKDIENQ